MRQPSLLDDFEDDEGDGEEDSLELFPFFSHEKSYVDQIIRLVKQTLCYAEYDAQEIRSVARLLLALQRLPLPTPGIDVVFDVGIRYGEELVYYSLAVTQSHIELKQGGVAYSPQVGSDSYSSVVFEIARDGDRGPEYALEEWIDGSQNLVSEQGEVSIEDFSSDRCDEFWDDPSDDAHWDELPSIY